MAPNNKACKHRYALLMAVLIALGLMLILPEFSLMPARNPQRLAGYFAAHADTSAAGVTQEEYPQLARSLSDFLSGKQASPQVFIINRTGVGEEAVPAYSQREQDHLLDVRELFQLARSLSFLGIFLLLLPILLAFRIARGSARKTACLFARWLWLGILITALGLLVVALMASVDFTGAFYVFHQLLFDNDLWQLDTGRHLLVQLMPEELFIAYASDAWLRAAALLLGLFAASWLAYRLLKGKQAINEISVDQHAQ